MKISQSSSFVKYELNEEEFKVGTHLSIETRAILQNLIADCAEEKITSTYDPSDPLKYAQVEAELQGKIGILKYVLSLESQYHPEVN